LNYENELLLLLRPQLVASCWRPIQRWALPQPPRG